MSITTGAISFQFLRKFLENLSTVLRTILNRQSRLLQIFLTTKLNERAFSHLQLTHHLDGIKQYLPERCSDLYIHESVGHHASIFIVALLAFMTFTSCTTILILVFALWNGSVIWVSKKIKTHCNKNNWVSEKVIAL